MSRSPGYAKQAIEFLRDETVTQHVRVAVVLRDPELRLCVSAIGTCQVDDLESRGACEIDHLDPLAGAPRFSRLGHHVDDDWRDPALTTPGDEATVHPTQ